MDGDAKWFFDDVAVTPGTQYTFSNKYKSTAPSSYVARYTSTTGVQTYVQIGTVQPSADWTQFSVSFTPPADTASLTIFHLLSAAGTLTVDAYSLTLFTAPPAVPGAFDKGYVTLSFDDGWTSHYRNVLPMLNNAGLKATFFVMSDEAKHADEENLNDPNSYLTYARLKELQTAGHEVTAHTRTHSSLVGLSSLQAKNEVQGSREDLLNEGFTPVSVFAYPFGDYNNNVIQIVKDAGFAGARSVDGGYNTKLDDKYVLKVQNVLMGTSADQMKEWINHAVETKTWVTLVFHQVDTSLPNQGVEDYSTTPAKLQAVLEYLKQNNIAVVTAQQGLQLMQ